MLNDPRKLDTFLYLCQSHSRGGGDHPPPSHAWSGLLIAGMFQDGLKEWITEVVVLAPGEAILFFGRWSCKEGLSYTSARDVGFSLTGPVNWARRTVQVEVTANMEQEGLWAIADAVMEKKIEVRGPGCPWGLEKAILSLASTCNVDDWIGEWTREHLMRRWGGLVTSHVQCIVGCSRQSWWQRAPRIPRGSPGGSPSLGAESSSRGSDCSSVLLATMRTSSNSYRSVCVAGAFWWRSTCPSLRMKWWRML